MELGIGEDHGRGLPVPAGLYLANWCPIQERVRRPIVSEIMGGGMRYRFGGDRREERWKS